MVNTNGNLLKLSSPILTITWLIENLLKLIRPLTSGDNINESVKCNNRCKTQSNSTVNPGYKDGDFCGNLKPMRSSPIRGNYLITATADFQMKNRFNY